MSQARTALGVLAVIFAVLLVPQFYLAGAMAFSGLADGTDAHVAIGGILSLISLVILVLALVTRTHVRRAVALFVLMILQNVLAVVGTEGSDWVGALHAVNAIAIVAVGVELVQASGMIGKRRRPASTTSTVS